MDRSFHLYLLLLFFSSKCLAEAPRQEKRNISINIREEANGGQTLVIEYSPFYGKIYRDALKIRTAKDNQTPNGARDYWNKVLPASGVFHAELNSYSASDWDKLGYDLDDDVLEIISDRVLKFSEQHASSLSKANQELLEKLKRNGIFAELIASPNMPDVNFKDQAGNYLLEITDEMLAYRRLMQVLSKKILYPKEIGTRALRPGMESFWNTSSILRGNVYAPQSALTETVLIVTHASEKWDKDIAAKSAIDSLIASFKRRSLPVVFLMDNDHVGDAKWYTNDRAPTFAVFSQSGEHNLPIKNSDITIAGGYFGACHLNSMKDAISRYFLHGNDPLKIHLPMAAIFTNRRLADGGDKYLTLLDLQNEVKSLTRRHGTGAAKKFLEDFLYAKFTGTELYSEDLWVHFLMQKFFGPFVENQKPNPLGTELGLPDFQSGSVSTKDYQFEIYLDGVLMAKHGSGAKMVELRFESKIDSSNSEVRPAVPGDASAALKLAM